MNTKLLYPLLYSLAAAFPMVAAQADTIAFYEFENVYTSSDTEVNSIASAVTGGAGLNPSTPVFSSTSFAGSKSLAAQNLTEDTEAFAVSVGDYIEFTISANSGFEIDYTDLTVALQRSNSPGSATDVFLRTSLDGYTSTVGTASPTTSFAEYTISLSSIEFQNVSSDITFRLYAFGGDTATSSLRHDNLTVLGTVTAIPEPATTGLLMTAGVVAFAGFRRKRKA